MHVRLQHDGKTYIRKILGMFWIIFFNGVCVYLCVQRCMPFSNITKEKSRMDLHEFSE